jgi:CMP/dCMP kinase
MSRQQPIVAIDGPAGAGKSTVTRRVAAALNYLVLDTGAIYRSVALASKRSGVTFADESAVAAIAADLAARGAIAFRAGEAGSQSVWLDGNDVSLAIRTQEMGEGASLVSAIGGVRSALLDLQRQVGRAGGVVVEGRDIGSVVFPDAEAKFFLTASVAVRAQRRLDELLARGEVSDFDTVAREVRERDERDRHRAIAPLVQAPDARLVDSSNMSLDQVVTCIVGQIHEIVQRMKSQG